MAQTLLALCQQASREMGIGAPATIISNTDLYAVQLLNLLNGVGQDLAREHEWQGLVREHSFSTENYVYTGNVSGGNTNLTDLSSIASLDTTFMITGSGVPGDTFIVTVGAATVVMSREASVTATGGSYTFSKVQYALPTGFDRIIDDTQWDKTRSWPMHGPNSAQQWQWYKGSILSTGQVVKFRIIRNLFQLYAPITTENFMRYEFVSAYWGATGASATPTLSELTADTNTTIYPDRLMIEALKLRFRIDKGMAKDKYTPADIERGLPVRLLDMAKAADAGAPSLTMMPRARGYLLNQDSIPDSDYGS